MSVSTPFWHELSTTDFAALDAERTVVVLPVAAVEQHGPHLPLMTDACIAQGLIARMLELRPAEPRVLVLPMTWTGKSDEHRDFPGTLTHDAATLAALWQELGASVAQAGLRKLLILNSHGGQIPTSQIVARALRQAHAMLVSAVIWPQLGLPPGLFTPEEQRFGIHAGDIETSLMLALRPDLVRLDRLVDFAPLTRRLAPDYPILMGLGAAGFGWQAQDLHPQGACGNATLASAEKGRAVLDHVAARLVELVAELARYPLAHLRARPGARA